MNISRREFLVRGSAVAGAAGAAVALPGCKTPPAVDAVRTISYATGSATSLVINETKLDAEQRTVLKEIVQEVRKYTPEVGQPLSVKFVAIAQVYVDAAVADGRIRSDMAVLIMAGARTASVGLDLLENRYPVIRTSVDYASAAIDGFSAGFLEHLVIECGDCTLKGICVDVSVVTEVRKAAVVNRIAK